MHGLWLHRLARQLQIGRCGWLLYRLRIPQLIRRPFQRHAVEHHTEYLPPDHFQSDEDTPRETLVGAIFDSFMPKLWVLLLPVYYGFYCAWGLGAGLGVATGTASYVILYEIVHHAIHHPGTLWFQNHRWFLFLIEHHRLHHRYHRVNYNVVLPLWDMFLKTLSLTEEDAKRRHRRP